MEKDVKGLIDLLLDSSEYKKENELKTGYDWYIKGRKDLLNLIKDYLEGKQ